MHTDRFSALFLVLLAGCVAPIPFDTVTLGGEPGVSTGVDATLEMVEGRATSEVPTIVPFGGTVVPPERTSFGGSQQAEFTDLLRQELLRLQVFRDIRMGGRTGAEPVHVVLTFRRTHYEPLYHHYVLRARLTIEHDGKMLERDYTIDSNAGESSWDLANSNLYESRIRAVQKLLTAIVPDIQRWAATTFA